MGERGLVVVVVRVLGLICEDGVMVGDFGVE